MADEDLLQGNDQGAQFIYLRLPCGTDCGALQVSRDRAECGPRIWHLEGDPRQPETLTLSPSIHLIGQWHGFLRGGKLESC